MTLPAIQSNYFILLISDDYENKENLLFVIQ